MSVLFKFSLANFATSAALVSPMFPLLWKAIRICELNSLEVLAVTCDGASPNRNLCKMHFSMTNDMNPDMNPDVDVTYIRPLIYSARKSDLFIADVPHLIKTARKCFSNSGSNRCTCYVWNNGMYIIWNHIADIFYENADYIFCQNCHMKI